MFFCVHLSSYVIAQDEITIKGKIVDQETNTPLLAATIGIESTSIGTITNHKGVFSLKVNTSNHQTVLVRYMGYESLQIPIVEFKNKTVTIGLKRSSQNIDEVVILAKPPVIQISEKNESIRDFVVSEDYIIMLTKKRGKGLFLTLTDYDGNIASSISLDKIRLIDRLTTSCSGINYLLTEHYAYQLHIEYNIVYVVHKSDRKIYDTSVAACLDINDEYIYSSKSKALSQMAIVTGHHKKKDEKVDFGIIANHQNVANRIDEFDQKYMFLHVVNKHIPFFNTNPATIANPMRNTGLYPPFADADFYSLVFYKPINFFLFAEEKVVSILDHENHQLVKFNLLGEAFDYLPIHYSKEKSWSKEIIKDHKTKNIYTILKLGKEKIVAQIDPESGQIIPVLSFNLSFIDKVQIYNNEVFLTHSGLTLHNCNKVLKRVSL